MIRRAANVIRWCILAALTVAPLTIVPCGCTPKTYVPELASRPYPFDRHTTTVADIQCFRRDTQLEIVNSTARSYNNFDLWINQRYVHRVEALPAGTTLRLSLWDFIDDYGQRFYAGGFFRAYPPQPLRLVEIQSDAESPMLGLIAIRSEEVKIIQKLSGMGY